MDHDPLPQPPAWAVRPEDEHHVPTRPPLRRGVLGRGWRAVTVVAWIGVALGFGAVWRTSWTMGLSTWWLGPEASPRFVLLLVLPFVAPLVVTAAALRELPWVPYLGLAAAAACALVAWGDAGRVPGLAVVEVALAAGGLLVSLGSLAGLPRSVRTN